MRNETLESLMTDQLEWILSGQSTGKRFLQQLVVVAGYLATDPVPENIAHQLAAASKQITLLEVFDALLTPLNLLARVGPSEHSSTQVVSLIGQINEARVALQESESINHAEVISWLVLRAREKKLIAREKR